MEFGIISLLIIAVVIIFYSMRTSKAQKHEEAQLEDRLNDERIYDSLTGKYLTIEEAENVIVTTEDVFRRIKSDEEIEENYSPDQREVEYIVRHMIEADMPEADDDRIFELIKHSNLLASVDAYSINYLWEIKPEHFLGIADVRYQYSDGRNILTATDSQLIGIVQGDHWKSELKKYHAIEITELGTTQIFRIANRILYEDFMAILELPGFLKSI